MKRDVVISGVGIVSPVGHNVSTFWDAVLAGRSSFRPVASFDTANYPHHIGSEVLNFSKPSIVTPAEMRIYGKASLYAIESSHQALLDAGFSEVSDAMSNRFGVIAGTTFGEAQIIESATRRAINKQSTPLNIRQYGANSLSGNIAKKFHLRGPNFVVPTACAAGNYAVSYGTFLIQSGMADFMLVGGADPFSHVSFSGFSRLGVMADDYCRPFDRDRKGMLVGEGSGFMVLESYESAVSRNARPYARIVGRGMSCDATHMTTPNPDGVRVMMENALKDAGLKPSDIDYICAHGTGTSINDKTECDAIRKVFYSGGSATPVSSIKSVLGHTMGAASAIETIACCLAIRDGVMPPTANFQNPDPECEVDCVPNSPRNRIIKYALNNALAFGGNNSAVILGRIHE